MNPPRDFTAQGWDWPDSSSLLLMLGQVTELPTADRLQVSPDAECVFVSGCPLPLTLFDRPSLTPSAAALDGYLSEQLHLSINIHTPSREQRDQLIAGLLTLQLDPVRAVDV